MLDKSILLDIVKTSTTNAVKYVYLETNMPVSECREYVANFKIENGIDIPSGTITWFECEKVKPPTKRVNHFIQSEDLFLYKKGVNITVGNYYPEIECWKHNSGNWQPTYWAFINLPE